jgi:cellulose synthase/poly-beta-1,6-N-acetylglucosamine synthase-like glycosyltransferase
MRSRRRKAMKSPQLYLFILGLWGALMYVLWSGAHAAIADALTRSTLIGSMVVATLLFISYFWLNGVKDVVYTAHYHLFFRKSPRLPEVGVWKRRYGWEPRVLLLYCTYNDFNADSLESSMRQNYSNFETFVLDDSTKDEYKEEVDSFAARTGAVVIRRSDRSGFKAGNLNHFLRQADYDYFVILDSDEIIPPDFVSRTLDYFVDAPCVGIVQANHRATRNRTPFMRMFARGVDSHWPTYQLVKDRHGFMSLLGHGAMVSRTCYEAANGFPHVVAEDICFSIAAREAGYYTIFALDVVCEEEYPPDYMAFKKRHGKWTEGNMEFIRKNTWKIFTGKMKWYEKLDIVLFTYSLPLTALFSVYVVINVVAFPLLDYTFRYPLWMLTPTALFLVAPMLNDIVTYWRRMSKLALFSYLMHSTLLYGSMYYVSLRSSLKSAFGKSIFHVTPKNATSMGFRDVIRANKGEITFGVVVSVIVIAVTGSIFPVFLIVTPTFFALYLTVLHHERRGQGKGGRRKPSPLSALHEAPDTVSEELPLEVTVEDTMPLRTIPQQTALLDPYADTTTELEFEKFRNPNMK